MENISGNIGQDPPEDKALSKSKKHQKKQKKRGKEASNKEEKTCDSTVPESTWGTQKQTQAAQETPTPPKSAWGPQVPQKSMQAPPETSAPPKSAWGPQVPQKPAQPAPEEAAIQKPRKHQKKQKKRGKEASNKEEKTCDSTVPESTWGTQKQMQAAQKKSTPPMSAWGPQVPQKSMQAAPETSAPPKSAWGPQVPQKSMQAASETSAWGPQVPQKPAQPAPEEAAIQKPRKHQKKQKASNKEEKTCDSTVPESTWGTQKQMQAAQETSTPPMSAWGLQVPQKSMQAAPETSAPPKSAWGPQVPQKSMQAAPETSAPSKSAWGPQVPQKPAKAAPETSAPPKSAWGPQVPQKPAKAAPETSAPPKSAAQNSARDTSTKKHEKSTDKETLRKLTTAIEATTITPKKIVAERICADNKRGRPITVATNFYRLKLDTETKVYHYHVTMNPDKPAKLLRNVWEKFCSQHFKNLITCFDGKTIALSRKPLISEISFSSSVTVINPENNAKKDFNVTIQLVRKISFKVFQNYREEFRKNPKVKILPEEEIAVIEIILKNQASEQYVKTNKVFFPSTENRHNLSQRIHLCDGFFQSAFLGYQLYLNFDISYKPFYAEKHLIPVYDSMTINRFGERTELAKDIGNSFFNALNIEYELPNNPSSRRRFRVNKLVDNAYNTTFEKDGVKVNVADYFMTEKKLKLNYPDYPLLWVGPRDKSIYIPMEFCKIVKGQIFKGALTPDETKEMVKCCTTDANKRRYLIERCFKKIQWENNPYLKEFGISVSDRMEEVKGRILDPPMLQTSEDVKVWNGEWKSNSFLHPVAVNKWCVINFDKKLNDQYVNNLQNMIKSQGNLLKMKIGDPAKTSIKCDNPRNHNAVLKIFESLKDMSIVFVIIPEAKGLYSKVKTICETQQGILTQCIKSKTVMQDSRKISTTIQNILLKVNTKLGGRNHSLSSRTFPPILKGYVMIVGADVTHPSPGSSLPSVAGVAVSYDSHAFQYSVSQRVQYKEVIKDLCNILKFHLSKFREVRGQYPEKILFFRDGVSEGEMEHILEKELKAVKEACRDCCDPKITLIVVSKRHHTRFFATRPQDEDGTRNCNVPVGTCIDTDIVHPRDMEFYLLSHKSIQGTARPTRYRLLYDDNKITDDELETLTYYLCHMYSRCKRSVSYPSPTYYAHLVAYRARSYLDEIQTRNFTMTDLDKVQKLMEDKISKSSPMFFV